MNESIKPVAERGSLPVNGSNAAAVFERVPANCSREVLREVIARNIMAWIGAVSVDRLGAPIAERPRHSVDRAFSLTTRLCEVNNYASDTHQ